MERVRPGWITRRDTKRFAKKAKMIDEEKQKEEDKKWEERYKSRWEGSRGCFPKKFTDAVSKRTKDEKTAKKYIEGVTEIVLDTWYKIYKDFKKQLRAKIELNLSIESDEELG